MPYIRPNPPLITKKLEKFFVTSNELLTEYAPGSFLYKQDSHSVSAYLFLYDPDHNYMYKAMQSKVMADCIEFGNDWGTGNNIKLDGNCLGPHSFQ